MVGRLLGTALFLLVLAGCQTPRPTLEVIRNRCQERLQKLEFIRDFGPELPDYKKLARTMISDQIEDIRTVDLILAELSDECDKLAKENQDMVKTIDQDLAKDKNNQESRDFLLPMKAASIQRAKTNKALKAMYQKLIADNNEAIKGFEKALEKFQ